MPLSIRNLSNGDEAGSETTLWKYLTFEKFLDFLLMKRLYFRRVDRLHDPYECLMPPGMYATARDEASPEAWKSFLKRHDDYISNERSKVFVNSWHVSEHESEAMWKLFGGSGHSLAVQTTFGALVSELAPHDLTAGKVLYKDVAQDDCQISDIYDFSLLKRRPFEHEKEFRLIFINDEGDQNPRLLDPNGLHITVEPAHIIESIYVSPLSEPWQYELSLAIIKREGLSDRVTRSTLFNCPVARK
ncbi:MAG: hypothetical protein ACLGQW_07985 [Acidobacteriota bacterium]